MSNKDDIQKLEISMEQAKAAISMGHALQRLYVNPDFKTIVLDGFLTQEALRLVIAKSEPGTQTPEAQAGIIKGIDSIGYLNAFFLNLERMTEALEKDLASDVETMGEMLQDDAE